MARGFTEADSQDLRTIFDDLWPDRLSETSTSVLSQWQTFVLSQQQTSVLPQQQTSVLSEQKTSVLSHQQTKMISAPFFTPKVLKMEFIRGCPAVPGGA